MKRLLLSFLLTFSTIISFAQSWQGKPVVRIENDGQSFLYTFSDSSTAYINKCNVSYIVNMPNSVWVQLGYMYDGSTSRIITASYSAITQPDLASAKILSDTLNAWLRDCQTSGGGGGGGSVDSIYFYRTIAQLRIAMSSHTLLPGSKYQATDFQTIYDQPDFDDEGNPKTSVVTKTASVEPLVFTANSDSTFDNYVSSTIYNTDIIKFDWTYTQTEVMEVAAKGKIIYREDTLGNRLDYDFRKVLFKRYRDGANGYSVWYDNDSVSAEFPTFDFDNYLIRYTSILGFETVHDLDVVDIPFHLSNNVFRKNSLFNKMDNVFCNTFMDNAHEVVAGDGIVAMTCLGGIYYSYFGHGAYLVTFLGNAENNYFGDQLENSVFGARCNDNSIWDKMENFTAGSDFKRNIQYGKWSNSTVGDNFTDGVIYGLTDSITAGDNNFKIDIKSGKSITIGDNNSNISFGGTKYILPLNDFNGVKNVVFGGSISGQFWSNGINTTDHPEFYNNTSKTVILGSDGSVYGRYFNGTSDVTTIIN